MSEPDDREYGIIANVFETDKLFPDGAKVWISGGTGGEGWFRFRWLGRTRGGRIIEKWAPTMRFHNFRAAWVPEHLEERVYYLRGSRSEMEGVARRLVAFAAYERAAHPNRRGAVLPFQIEERMDMTIEGLMELGFQVRVEHIRVYDAEPPSVMMDSRALDRGFEPAYRLNARGGLTRVTIEKDGETLAVGLSPCSKNDNYVKRVGLTKALNRAFGELAHHGLVGHPRIGKAVESRA